jgi:hypothetical protein
VRQYDLGEYEENTREKQRDINIQDKSQAPLKLSYRDANTKLPPPAKKQNEKN